MRAAICFLIVAILTPAVRGDDKVDPTVLRDIEAYWDRESTAKLTTTERVESLASMIQRDTGIEPPTWWQEQISATLNDQLSSASPRIKTNARLEQRGSPSNHKHVIVMNDGREFAIETLDGDWNDQLQYANVYKHKNHAYVLDVGGVMNPFPVYKLSTDTGAVVWRTMISSMPTIMLGGMGMPHKTGVSLRDGKLVVFGFAYSTAYAFAIDDSSGDLNWQFALSVHGDQHAPLFGKPPPE